MCPAWPRRRVAVVRLDEATATGSLGQGGAINLPEGTHDLVLTAPAGPCAAHSFSWQMAEDGTIPVPIRAGYTTAIDIIIVYKSSSMMIYHQCISAFASDV